MEHGYDPENVWELARGSGGRPGGRRLAGRATGVAGARGAGDQRTVFSRQTGAARPACGPPAGKVAGMKAHLWMPAAAAVSLAAASCGQAPLVPVGDTASPPAAERTGAKRVLDCSLAGSWYPARAGRLRETIEDCLTRTQGAVHEGVNALILPHAGYKWSGAVAASGVRQLAGQSFRRVVVIGPSHSVPMRNAASLPDATHYRTPLGEVPLDTACMEALLRFDCFQQIPGVHEKEHSVQIEVPFLQHALGNFALVPIVVGDLDPECTRRMAGVLRSLIDEETLVVASTDFTHYGIRFGYRPAGEDIPGTIRSIDMKAWKHIEAGDADGFKTYCRETGATVCGRNAVGVFLAMLPPEARPALLHYDTSGNITGDFNHSVSYLSAAVPVTWTPRELDPGHACHAELTPADEQALLDLARTTLEASFRHGRDPHPGIADLRPTDGMKAIGGAFVTLTKEGALRGCIGDIYPTRPLYESVMDNALRAALHDSRFPPVDRSELPDLRMKISALTPPRDVDSFRDIELGRHGIVLRKGNRRAVYLPEVAIGQGWDLPTTLTHLSRKAGLPGNAWESGAQFRVFEAIVFEEPERPREPKG